MATFTKQEVNFTKQEADTITTTFKNISSRMLNDTTPIHADDKPIADGYGMMARLLQNRLDNDASLSKEARTEIEYVKTWFEGAEKVNRGIGSFSTLIRTYSDIQGELRYGSKFTSELMQQASNKVGHNAFENLNNNIQKGILTIPTMEYIAEQDATGVGEVLFNRDENDTAHAKKQNSAWSGVSLFSVLGNDQTHRILGSGKNKKFFDDLTDLRDSMFLVESFRHAFSETAKHPSVSSAIQALTQVALNPASVLNPFVFNALSKLAKELGMFLSPEMALEGVKEFIAYKSKDFKITSDNFLQSLADIFLLTITKGHSAYSTIKNIIKYGNHNILETLQEYYNLSKNDVNYDNFITNAYQIFNKNRVRMDMGKGVAWLPESPEAISQKALQDSKEGLAFRYALKKLNPIVFGEEFDFTRQNGTGELDLYSLQNPNGMTETYIQKRAEMLHALMNQDADVPAYYHDLESNQKIGEYDFSGVSVLYPNRKVLFGTSDDDAEKLFGGENDDFLFGGAGNDVIKGNNGDDYLEGGVDADKLYGGKGFDTYFADLQDTILDSDGSGTVFLGKTKLIGGVQDLTGKEKDLYRNEDGSITYRWNKETKELTVNDGLIIQDFDNQELGINLVEAKGQDIAFVVDTTGSMADDIGAVQREAKKIINMLFDPARNMAASRVAVVGYNDPSTETLLKFTDHETVGERKQAALSAINRLYARDGGDRPEMLYSGLLRALDGRAGKWSDNATAQRIFVFGDAPAKDDYLAGQVKRLANALGVEARSVESRMLSKSVEKTEVVFQTADKSPQSVKTRTVEIFTILIGNNPDAAADFTDIANSTGGSALNANGANDIANVLYDALQSGTGGDDVQIGNEANNTFNGRAGNDKLFGHAGNDTLNGGVGNDLLNGGEGADKFVFNRHFGQDVVYSDILDTFVFDGVSLDSLKFIQTANHDLLIQQQGTQNQITVAGFFDGQSSFAALQDNSGNTLSASQVLDMAQPVPTIDDNQNIKGNIFANHLVGGSGDDVLRSHAGADTLRGGLGNDRLEGGLGADTYLFKAGDGHDRLFDAVGNDTLRFEDVALDRLWFSREGRNLKIDVLDGGGSVTIENQYLNTKSNHLSIHAVEHFQAGKHRLLVSTVKKLLNVMDKFSPVESADLDVDAQKYQYLQDVNIEKYWHNPSEQY